MKLPSTVPLLHTAILGLATAMPAAMAQTAIYRCGNSYSQTPCAEGAAQGSVAPRSPLQQPPAEARAIAQRERQTGDALEKQRLKEEAQLHRELQRQSTAPTGEAPSSPPKTSAAQQPPHRRTAKPPAYFTARGADEKKTKK